MAIQRDKIIANAEKLVAKGKIEPAIKEYEHLLDDNPNDVNTLNRIGDLWVRINRTDEAVKTFGKIADHYSRDGFFLKAIAIYKKINKLDPSKLDVYAKLADLYAKQGLAMEAKSQYQVLADYYLKHGDANSALTIYRKIAELDPNAIQVHVKLADLYSQNNQTGEALKEYDRVGRALLKRGMLDEAVQVFKKALKIDAKNVELVESLVAALLEAKDLNNAQAIVETALASNQNNPRLLAAWAKILVAKGDVASAKSGLERAIAENPQETAPREVLAELYLRQGNADKALEMLGPVADKALAQGNRGAAVEAMNRVLRVSTSHAPTLEKLVGIYSRLNEETNILASMNTLAEAHIANGRYEQAAAVLDKLIQREPQNAQHRNKLQFVKSQVGGVDTIPTKQETAPPPAMEIEEPGPALDFDETPSTSLDLESSPPIELDFGAVETTPHGAPPPRIDAAAAAPSMDVEPATDDLDFITEHLTEAEVFAKYGLAEKAAEHLRAVIDRAPRHLPAHEKLYKILLDEGEIDGARSAAMQYVKLLQEESNTDAIDAVRNEFSSRGQSLPVPSGEPALSFDDSATVEELESEPPLPEIETELTFEEETTGEELPSIEEELPSIEEIPTAEEDLPSFELPSIEEEQPAAAAAEELTFDMNEEPALSFDETPAETAEPFFGTEAVGGLETEAIEEPAPAAPTSPSVEDLGEIDFFIEQEMFDEARDKLDALSAQFTSNKDLTKRRTRLDAAVAAAEAIKEAARKAAEKHAAKAAKAAPAPAPPPPPAPVPPPIAEPEAEVFAEDNSDLLSLLPDEDFVPTPPPPPPAEAAPPPPPAPVLTSAQEENLFADEDDFFDLASELESELAEDSEQISLSEEEQSLEEIFKEFKKGVEQQLDSEDYDTHYNLGIAYKEMGLIDEAIGEFQLASKDPKRAVECASMLGLCFLEKGMPQLAIKWYRKGLEIPEITEEEHLGLLYDLGSAYMEVGDNDNAQKAFMEVYGLNTSYRDIATRIKQLEDARK